MGRPGGYFNTSEAVRPVPHYLPRMTRAAALVTAIGVAAGITACAPVVDDRGHLPDPERWAQIHPGTTTRDQVVKILGTPSSTGVFDTSSWYYISRKTKTVAFFDPSLLDQQVYVINFDGNGVVKSVEHKGMKDGRDIAMAPGATPAPGRELTFLEQVLGNIGRFNRGNGKSVENNPSEAPNTGGPRPYDPNR